MLAVITDPLQDWLFTLFKVVCVFAVVMPMVAYSVVAERRSRHGFRIASGRTASAFRSQTSSCLALVSRWAHGLKAW
ncbi:MAG: hypothetical protein CM1200mP29_01890 [Verrucomicrobiota bacterium]|nr:MAG: hypothetical protein CM1200mP29_01890 [Verrucomicrobiota bacterium]